MMDIAGHECVAQALTPNGRIALTLRRTNRPSGRRILAHTLDGVLLFDSGACYDLDNAIDAYDRWARSEAGAEAGA